MHIDTAYQANKLMDEIAGLKEAIADAEHGLPRGLPRLTRFNIGGSREIFLSPGGHATVRAAVLADLKHQLAAKEQEFDAL